MTVFRQARVQLSASTLPGHYYTTPEIFYQETQRIFYNHWLCVGRSEQIPEVGDYFLAQIGEENLIVLRDSQGTARAFFNVCRHRGTRLCTQAQGHLVETIQCPYHSWTYSLEGQLRTTRQMSLEDFAVKDNPLFACVLYEWEGFLWVNLAPNPAPFTQIFAPLLNRFTPWRLATLRVGQQIVYDVQANWKLIFQNYSDRYRCSAEQPLTQTSSTVSRGNDLSEGAFLGGYRSLDLRYEPEARTADRFLYRTSRRRLAGVRGEDRFRVHYYSLFPTMLLSLHPDYAIAQRLYPQSENRTRVVCEWLFNGTTATDPTAGADAIEQGDLINRQDWYVCEGMQQEMSLRTLAAHRHSEQTAFNQEYLRVLGKHTS